MNTPRNYLITSTAIVLSLNISPLMADSLENSNFNSDLSGWDNPSLYSASWDPLDAEDTGDSGSALLTHEIEGNNGTLGILHQCLAISPGAEYEFGALTYIPAGEPAFTAGIIIVFTYATADCTGDLLQFEASSFDDDQGIWGPTTGSITTDSGTASAEIRLGVRKASGVTDDASVHFDNVYVDPPEEVFRDRFEQSP